MEYKSNFLAVFSVFFPFLNRKTPSFTYENLDANSLLHGTLNFEKKSGCLDTSKLYFNFSSAGESAQVPVITADNARNLKATILTSPQESLTMSAVIDHVKRGQQLSYIVVLVRQLIVNEKAEMELLQMGDVMFSAVPNQMM